MNIYQSNSQHSFQNQNGSINILGNSNLIAIRNSNMTIMINGNNNQLQIYNSRLTININGNTNLITVAGCSVNFGFNGNLNQLRSDNHSQLHCQYCNGIDNKFPRNQPMLRNLRRQEIPQRSQRIPRNQTAFTINENRHQLRQNRQNRGGQQYSFPQQNQHRSNRRTQFNFNMEELIPPQIDIFQQIQRNMRVIVGNLERQRPIRQIFSFRNQFDEQEPQESQEEQKGLNHHQVDLLPRTLHTGKEGKCSICLCEIEEGEQQTFLICIHNFHWGCIKDWMLKNAKCPVCQHDHKEYLRA